MLPSALTHFLVRGLRASGAAGAGGDPRAERAHTREDDVTEPDMDRSDAETHAGHVLEAFRERRRRRRGEDTYFGSSALLLGPDAASGATPEGVRRRAELMDDAHAAGMSPELADMMYDIAVEEGLDPGLAFELVRSGLGVAPPEEGLDNAPAQPTSDKYTPAWLVQPPTPTDTMLRERMLRLSFRRVRGLLEAHPDPDDAFRAFAREPDVGAFGY
jgi:hypothetical protein